MASIQDVFDQLTQANTRLQSLHNDLQTVHADLGTINTTMGAVRTSVEQGNSILFHISQQDDTVICLLEHVSRNTCAILNEAHLQTGYQKVVSEQTRYLAELYELSHPAEAVQARRLNDLQEQVLKCCPPETPEPACKHEKCYAPEPLKGQGTKKQEPIR